jgi:hypothetical protein
MPWPKVLEGDLKDSAAGYARVGAQAQAMFAVLVRQGNGKVCDLGVRSGQGSFDVRHRT